jgi:hypothetical protein
VPPGTKVVGEPPELSFKGELTGRVEEGRGVARTTKPANSAGAPGVRRSKMKRAAKAARRARKPSGSASRPKRSRASGKKTGK